ncbi:MAG: hypothetical protein JWN46_1522 [Acidimicrobiales bacterium]|nr:hypothetical protein [Acidimicrobiales bacterium]
MIVVGVLGACTHHAAPAEAKSDAEVAHRAGCTKVRTIDRLEAAAIRGSAATRGIRCTVGHDTIDVFTRAQVPAVCRSPNDACGGSLSNIDRLLQPNTPRGPECVPRWLLTARRWFVVSSSRQELEALEPVVGGQVRPILPLGSPASYQFPGCPS